MSLSLVFDNGLLREAAGHGFDVALISVKVGANRFGKNQVGHGDPLRYCDEITIANLID
jgi:hypothetical protein